MDQRVDALNRWLQAHHGVITRERLRAMGFASTSITRMLSSGRLCDLCAGIYVSTAVSIGRLQVMSAVCQRYPEVAIGFVTAGGEWGFRGMGDRRIHVLAPHALSRVLPDVVVHRCRRIDPVDLAGRRRDAIRLTSPPRTLFDCAGLLDLEATASAVEQAIADRRCTMDTLLSTMSRLGHGNRPGSRQFEAVLLSRPVLRGAARSELERTVRAALQQGGLPEPTVNMPFLLSTGEMIVIDFAWPDWKLALEVDHPFWHDREAEAARDKRRDRKLAAMGWVPQRLSKIDVERRLAESVDDVRQVLIACGWTPPLAA